MTSPLLFRIPTRLCGLLLCALVLPALADDQPATKPKVLQITLEQFEQKRLEKDILVLDVRSEHEFAEGHVPGAMNLNVHGPKFQIALESVDKSKTYLVYCAKGVRSQSACEKMTKVGFEHVLDFHGGFTAWENAHKPIAKGEES